RGMGGGGGRGVTGAGKFGGGRVRSPQRWWGLILAALAAGIAVLFSPVAHGQVPVWSARVDLPAPPVVSPTVVTQPGDGATFVSPIEPVRASVSGGALDAVALTNPEGKQVAGRFSPDRTSWTAAEPLGYGKTYTWSGTATGIDHLPRAITGSFQTVAPERLVSARFNVVQNATYGIAMPIALTFSSRVIDKAAVERALDVRVSVPTEGSWAWLNDTTVHWRPRNYFAPNIRVTVTAKLYGVAVGGGAFGREDIATAFTIGRSYVLRGDTRTHRLVTYANGVRVADYPASYGLDSDPGRTSHSGTHVVMEKYPVFYMSNPKYHYQNVEARSAVRISSNGEFIHAAPWSVAQQGKTNVSHGCVNLSPANAAAVFDAVLTGDPVEITGSSRQLTARDGDYYDWTIPWDAWTARSALSRGR
ncbi:MAG TPA: Ig-like domain-containing protein, partial [Pseudonocardiaceae bacterium]|nr:Ig-like domain-containing protein [Pseudonocardiaceae bacterium]